MSGIFIEGQFRENTGRRCRKCKAPLYQSDTSDRHHCTICQTDVHESEADARDPGYVARVVVMRHADGITLNPVCETLLDEQGAERVFGSEDTARNFLADEGADAEEMEFLFFVELDNMASSVESAKVEGTIEDTGFKGIDFCDEYCSKCEHITFNVPTDRVSRCAHCGVELFPCAACEQEDGCQWTEETGCQRFTSK